MNQYIERLPLWGRRILALPLALAGFSLVRAVLCSLMPPNYMPANFDQLEFDWIASHIEMIATTHSLVYLASAATFMLILYHLVPVRKFAAVLATSIAWSLLLISSLLFITGSAYTSGLLSTNWVWTLPVFVAVNITMIIFFACCSIVAYRKQKRNTNRAPHAKPGLDT